jgi:hypothetical protein
VRLAAWQVLLALAASAPAPARRIDTPGRFVAHAGPRLVAGATGTYDVLRLDGVGRRARIAIVATCPPVRVRVHGRRVTAAWRSGACGVAGRIRLAAHPRRWR